MNELEHLLNNIWTNDLSKRKKFLNFAKLYNKNLSKIIISDDIINMIVNKLKTT